MKSNTRGVENYAFCSLVWILDKSILQVRQNVLVNKIGAMELLLIILKC